MLMHGHDLYGHLDGTKPAPSHSTTQNNRETDNPQFRIWFRQDQLIQQALMAFVDPTIAPTVAAASNSQKAWDLLHTSFANKSQTCIFSLRNQLTKVSKESKSVGEYLREIRSLF
ncbi:hypothetical protein ACH5RR_029887 [Cinchona calisaya]|uniref:Uncharacterized protein n=1 Tax=Cinchona calisaya TaxID=153742 RepID=A0ABD2YSY4_9GENT